MLLLFKVNCDKPFLAKFNKDLKLGTEWEKCAETISVISPFLEVGGITGRAAKAKFKELLSAHREEVKSREFTRSVRDGMDDATHDAFNKCMKHVDEAIENTAKAKGESAEYEASKQERAEVVLVGSICRAASRVLVCIRNCCYSFSDGAVWSGSRFFRLVSYGAVQCRFRTERPV